MRWKRAIFRGVALFGLNIETMRINPAPVVLAPLARIEAHGVQVRDCRGPARRLQHFNSRADELGVERVRLRMSEDEVGAHGMAFLPTGSKAGLLPGEGLRYGGAGQSTPRRKLRSGPT